MVLDAPAIASILLALVPLVWVVLHYYRRIVEIRVSNGNPESMQAEMRELKAELKNLRETLYHQTVAVEYALTALRIPPEESNRLER